MREQSTQTSILYIFPFGPGLETFVSPRTSLLPLFSSMCPESASVGWTSAMNSVKLVHPTCPLWSASSFVPNAGA